MAGSNQLSLDIVIKAIADAKGIIVTKEEVAKLTAEMNKAAAAGESLDVSVGGITEALQKQKRETASAATDWDKLSEAQKQSQREAAQVALKQINAAEAAKKASAEAGSLAKNVNSARTAFSGLKDVIGGAVNGNILQVGQGLGKISAAATTASPAMQGLFTQIARGAAAASVAAGPIIIGIQFLKSLAAENEAAMTRMWAEAAKGAEAYKTASASVKAAAEADLAAITAAVEKLGNEYDSLVGRMDKAAARQKEIDAANKDLEMAGAKSPEEKAAIEAKYAKNDVSGDISQAGLRKSNAEAAIRQASQNYRDAETSVRDAEAAFKLKPTRANQEAVAAAKANLETISQKNSPIIQKAQAEIEAADHVITVGGIREKTLSKTTAASTAATNSSTKDRQAELRRTAEEAQARGDFKSQDAAVAELRRVTAAADKLAKAVVSNGATTTAALNAAAKELEKQKRLNKNGAQGGPGGG